MPEILAIVLDNGMQSQNQDYSPSRIIVQIDAINRLITQKTSASTENKIGIIGIAQLIENDIVTPTSERQGLLNYIYRCELQENINLSLALYQADQALELSDLTTKSLVMFLSSTIADKIELICELSRLEDKGVCVKLICFGDALEFGLEDAQVLKSPSFDVLCIMPGDDFESEIEQFLFTEMDDEDEDFKEAIRQSKLSSK